MGRKHEVLNSRVDTRIPDLFTFANTIKVTTTIDYDGHFLGVPKHLCSLIIDILHPRRHSPATGEPGKPGPQHRFLETSFQFHVSNNNEFPWLRIASGGCFGRGLEDDFQLVLRDRVMFEFSD